MADDRTFGTVVGKKIEIRGSLKGDEDIEIQGVVHGRIETTGALLIADSARVGADVSAGRVNISGEIRCKVITADVVDIDAGAAVVGDIRAPRLHLADGARVRGHIDTVSVREELIDAVLDQLGASSMQVYAEPKWGKHSGGLD